MAIDVYKDWLGIPTEHRPPDHYQLLRLVQFEDDPEKVRAHYKKLNAHVRKYATGQYSVESQELLNELAKAMLCLTDPVRKREYDESLGREFAEDEDLLGRRPVAAVLQQQGALSREQAGEVEEFAERRGLSVRDAVVQMKLVDIETATRALAIECGMSYVDLEDMIPDDSVLDRTPRALVKRNSILPLFEDDGMLLVACADEPTHELEDELRLRFGMPMRAVLATPRAINQGIAKYYAAGMRDEAAAEAAAAAAVGGRRSGAPTRSVKAEKKAATPSVIEQADRRQLGILIMCFATMGSVLTDQLLKAFVLSPTSMVIGQFLVTLFVPPVVVAWVLFVYWKKK